MLFPEKSPKKFLSLSKRFVLISQVFSGQIYIKIKLFIKIYF